MTDGPARVVASAAVALFVVLGVTMSPRPLQIGAPVAVGIVLVTALAAWRRSTGWELAGTLLLPVAGIVVLGGVASNLVWMGFCAVAAWVALTSRLTVAVTFAALLELILIIHWLLDRGEAGWASWATGTAFSVVVCIFARRLRATVQQLREAQHQLAERTRIQERTRIATEVHDVIGHALTVSLLHISGAKLALDEEPEEAYRSLDEAENVTRKGLEEVRATVGLMRTDAPGERTPLPAATDLPELVESFRRVGAEVHLTIRGDLSAIGAARGLAAYRIVQEALTNAVRHAGAVPIGVVVTVADGAPTIRVTNPMRDADAATPRPVEGAGLRGMRERAAGVGGVLAAGSSGDAWQVTAELPR